MIYLTKNKQEVFFMNLFMKIVHLKRAKMEVPELHHEGSTRNLVYLFYPFSLFPLSKK